MSLTNKVPEMNAPDDQTATLKQVHSVLPEKYLTSVLALVISTFALMWAFFIPHPETIDDVGLFNATYMYLKYGTITYPSNAQFHTMTVHPPVHYWILGMLIKAGFPAYYAEAIPPLFFVLLGVLFVCRFTFPYAVKLGFLLGFSGFFLYWGYFPRVRPETHLTAALFAGLLALEGGRLENWKPTRLFLGAALVTYASSLHYVAYALCPGVLIYLIWVIWAKRRDAIRPAIALVAGGCAVGIPYLLLFIVPDWKDIILAIKQVGPLGGLAESIRGHFQAYSVLYGLFSQRLPTKLLFFPMAISIPLVLLSSIVLLAIPATRGVGLAVLPYQLFFLFGVHRKGYFMPEIILYVSATCIAVLSLAQYVAGLMWPRGRWLTISALAAVMGTSLLARSPVLNLAKVSLRPRLHEGDIARAAGLRILGPNALVGARLARFYQHGAAHSYMIEPDVLWRNIDGLDLRAYFGQFDAIAEDNFMSFDTRNEKGESISSWYALRLLNLRGFYFSTLNSTISYMLLTPSQVGQIQGYALVGSDRVAHFQQRSGGDYSFVSAICAVGTLNYPAPEMLFRNSYLLPAKGTSQKEIDIFISETRKYLVQRATISNKCLIRDEVGLSMEVVDSHRFLETLRNDQPIRFYERLDDALEARYGPQLNLKVTPSGWPASAIFIRGRHCGEQYRLSGPGVGELFRSDMDSKTEWLVNRYGKAGGLEIVPGGIDGGGHVGKYSSGHRDDHLSSPFFDLSAEDARVVFFCLWAEPVKGPGLPTVFLQDSNYSYLAGAQPVMRRADGWSLLAGFLVTSTQSKLRIAIQQEISTSSLIGKVLVVSVPIVKSNGCAVPH